MTTDRSFYLDLALGISVGLAYYFFGSYDLADRRHIAVSVSCGVGAYLFARYFIREFFFAKPPLTPEDLEKQLDSTEDHIWDEKVGNPTRPQSNNRATRGENRGQ